MKKLMGVLLSVSILLAGCSGNKTREIDVDVATKLIGDALQATAKSDHMQATFKAGAKVLIAGIELNGTIKANNMQDSKNSEFDIAMESNAMGEKTKNHVAFIKQKLYADDATTGLISSFMSGSMGGGSAIPDMSSLPKDYTSKSFLEKAEEEVADGKTKIKLTVNKDKIKDAMESYLDTLAGGSQEGTSIEELTFVFTINSDGKCVGIEMNSLVKAEGGQGNVGFTFEINSFDKSVIKVDPSLTQLN